MPRSTATIVAHRWWSIATAVALDRRSWLPSRPVTVILSDKGWVRAKATTAETWPGLSHHRRDGSRPACGRSNQQAPSSQASGRTYSLEAHTRPPPAVRGARSPVASALGRGRCAIW